MAASGFLMIISVVISEDRSIGIDDPYILDLFAPSNDVLSRTSATWVHIITDIIHIHSMDGYRTRRNLEWRNMLFQLNLLNLWLRHLVLLPRRFCLSLGRLILLLGRY